MAYIVENGKRINYFIDGGKVIYSDGKVAFPSIENIDIKLAYKGAAAESLPDPVEVFNEVIPVSGKQLLLGELSNVNIRIKPGNYKDVWIHLVKATNVKIDATGANFKSSSMVIGSADNLEMYGATFADESQRLIKIEELCNNVKFHNMSFTGIKDYVISYQGMPLYDGTDKTVSKDLIIEKCTFINTSQAFYAGGDYNDKGIYGLIRNFKFLNNIVKDCPDIGTVGWLGAIEDYEIAGNIIDNINYVFTDPNAPNGYHWGIFAMNGSGSFHDNKVTNHSGNLIRAWGASFGKETKEVLIYNNIAYNSHKYGAFELQLQPWITDYMNEYPDRLKPASAKVYNNTVGKMNTSKDWEGQVLDLYNTWGPVEHYNNLGFELNKVQGVISDMINYNGNGTPEAIPKNNKYFTKASEAVVDTINFKSLHKGIGAQ